MSKYHIIALDCVVDLDLTMGVDAKRHTKLFKFDSEQIARFGHRGPSIGFGGNGIDFTARGLISGSLSKEIVVEIGFLQSLTYNHTRATYAGEARGKAVFRWLTKYQSPGLFPIKDGKAGDDDFWFGKEHILRLTQPQVMKMGRPIAVAKSDIVKSTFPKTLPLNPDFSLQDFGLVRKFTTCLAIRFKAPLPPNRIYFLERVSWLARYAGRFGKDGVWLPAPDISQFYTVGSIQSPLPNFAVPPDLRLTGPNPDDSELIEMT